MAIFSELWKEDLGPYGNKLFISIQLPTLQTQSESTRLLDANQGAL